MEINVVGREAMAMIEDATRVRFTVRGGLKRPPVEISPATAALFERARALGVTPGHEIGGSGAHASHEHIRLNRWPDHVRLLTWLLKEI